MKVMLNVEHIGVKDAKQLGMLQNMKVAHLNF